MPDSPQPTGWQPVETAPKDGTRVLLWARECGNPAAPSCCMMGDFSKESFCGWINGEASTGWLSVEGSHGLEYGECVFDRHEIIPSHWMPMPSSPDV